MNKVIVVDGEYTGSAREIGKLMFERLAESFVLLGETRKILDEMSPAEIIFQDGVLPHVAGVKMNQVRLHINDFSGMYKLDDKEFGWTDLIRNAKFVKMDLNRIYDELLLSYKLKNC